VYGGVRAEKRNKHVPVLVGTEMGRKKTSFEQGKMARKKFMQRDRILASNQSNYNSA